MDRLIGIVRNRKRLMVAPLLGLPGLKLVPGSIKLAQQNHILHFNIINAVYKRFQPDIIFPMMDLSLEASALGQDAKFSGNKAAFILKQKFTESDFEMMKIIDITSDSRIRSYLNTMKLMSEILPDNVIKAAYVIGPFTLAALIMGADDTARAITMDPNRLHNLISFCLEVVLKLTNSLISSGAELICILEPTASLINPTMMTEFSGKYINKIAEVCLKKEIYSVLHICGNTMSLLESMIQTGVDGLSLDSEEVGVDLSEAAKQIPEDMVIIGNICPTGTILNGTPQDIDRDVSELIKKMKNISNFILSTGCDLPQDVSLENIEAFMQAARKY